MYSPEVTIVAAGTSALVLGIGLGFHLGKLYGMKLGIAARDFAESFGISQTGVQAGVPTQGPFNIPSNAKQAMIYSTGGGGAGGAGQIGSAIGIKPNWQAPYQNAVATGLHPTAAQQLLMNEMDRHRQQQQYAEKIAAINNLTPKSKCP